MICNKMFAKSFSRFEQTKFRYLATTVFFILSISFFILFKSHFGPQSILNLQLSTENRLEMLVTENISSSSQTSSGDVIGRKDICNVWERNFNICDVQGDVRIHGKSSEVFAVFSQLADLVGNESWSVRPYPRKENPWMMGFITEFTVNATVGHEEAPPCTVNHTIPAVVFATGGYAAVNHWHAFTDILIPLFTASAQFHGEVQFLVTNLAENWIMKFQAILEQLSRYEIINIDTEDKVHCFPRMIVGLKQYQEMIIDPVTASEGYSMKEFRKLLRNAYSLERSDAIKIHNNTQEKPRLLIVARKGTRQFLNANEMSESAKSIGFEVVISEAMENLDKFAQIVNSCDVMMGIHGAGLTNLVFLPDNAILLQVLPLGQFEWRASNCFGNPAKEMDLRYMEYKIKEEESSLIYQYPRDHIVFTDPDSVHNGDWDKFKSIFLDKQDVTIDISRFNATLLEVLELLHH